MLKTMRVRMPVPLAVFSFFLGIIIFSAPAHASTVVTSDISTDTRWTIDGSPYVVSFDNNPYFQHLLLVAGGAVLTIDPGVVIKFGAYNGITVNGALRAQGTAESPIIFTSLEDDTVGGDTNADGTTTTPVDEQWMHVQFNTDSSGVFDYSIVRYGGAYFIPLLNTGIDNSGGTLVVNHTMLMHDGYDGLGQHGGHTTLTNSSISDQVVGISMDGGALDISDTRVHDNAASGISHRGGVLSVVHSEIDHNGTGIMARSGGSIAVSNSGIHDNGIAGDSLGVNNQSQTIGIDARNNWWGNASGPYDPVSNATSTSNGINGNVVYSPWLGSDPFAPAPLDPCATPGSCASNVLFFPGMEGSRLYEGTGCGKTAEEKLWEPLGESITKIIQGAGDDKVKELSLDGTGESACGDVYTKEGDVVDSVGGSAVYQSFLDEMDGLKSGGAINDWKPVAYDWRLSFDDLLHKGAKRDGKIFYAEATSSPYIEQALRALAASSKTGKVTIVTHSNGGLVAKALLNTLGDAEATTLVDKVIMVAAPQSGAPVGIGGLLYGYDLGISSHGIPILHNDVARAFAQNSPMAYHLLPSEDYLESTAGDLAHPVARFAGDGYAKEEAAYGSTIANRVALDDFLLAKNGEREKPDVSDTNSAEILNSSLLAYANSTHTALDFWTPPAGIEVDQIAGWGIDTVAGIDFYTPPPVSVLTALEPLRAYRPIFTEDGDGTVPVPSALMMASSANVKRYWVDLHSYNKTSTIKRSHADLFEVPSLESFIKDIIENSTNTVPAYMSSSQPPPITGNKKLTFFLHSPLTLQLQDSSGNITGLAEDGSMEQAIPDSTYGEFGDVKYVTVPEGNQYQLVMHGQAEGTFSLDMQESQGGVITASSTIANVPTTSSTLAGLTVSAGIDTVSELTVDENGDGKDPIIISAKVGETVNYEPPAPALIVSKSSQPSARAAGGPGYSPYITVASTSVSVATTSTPIISTVPVIATTTPPAIASTTLATTTPIAAVKPSSPRRSIAARYIPKHLAPPIIVANIPDLSQTASVYAGASQQSIVSKWGAAVYNGLHGLWVALKKFF